MFDEHNAQADLKQDMLRHRDFKLRDGMGVVDDVRELEELERSAIFAADLVSVCSLEDQTRLSARYNATCRFAFVPNCVRVEVGSRPHREKGIGNVFFAGVLDYFPNAEAVSQISTDIGPAIRARVPSVNLIVAGRRMPRVLQERMNHDVVKLVQDPTDIEPLFWDSTMVVPLSMGGGTRLKILEAFAAGCSVVSTATGAEGLDAIPGTHYLRAESAGEFADSMAEIMNDPKEDLRRRQAAWDLVSSEYSFEAAATSLKKALSLMA
ncbi:glycosyltransferase [Actinoplanes sp. NPDC051633]|uniref:glycosyltransferase n=1 Tax=Actinoplanes sp. NPDC051633 TaxID=3155670 RepID=UPI00342493AA